jgi:hypothetical protein
MPAEIRPLIVRDNATILDAIRNDASTDYQRRIPAATQGSVSDTVAQLMNFRPHFNEFIDALVNRIGLVIARNTAWTNPLAEFKRGLLKYGDTIEEVQIGLLKAHVYNPDREYMEKDIFGTETPMVESNFHRINRQEFYKLTVNEPLLMRAFLDPNGLSSFVSQLMQAPTTSDQWDEFLHMCKLFDLYEQNGGFYHVRIPEITSMENNPDDARTALRKMRGLADTLKFISTKYNAAHMPTFANAEDLIIFVTPEFNAAVDVNALAGAFNIDRALMHGRIIPIPREQFGIQGCEAILTVRDLFVIADTVFETTSQFNPVTRAYNNFLHRQGVISMSRFVPAVMFNTELDDEVINLPVRVSNLVAIQQEDAAQPLLRGTVVPFTTSTLLSGSTIVDRAGVMWAITGNNSRRTYITSTGELHIALDETALGITIIAGSAAVDPVDTHKRPAVFLDIVFDASVQPVASWPISGTEFNTDPITNVVTPIISDDNITILVKGVAAVPTAVANTYEVTLPTGTKVVAADVDLNTISGAVDIAVASIALPVIQVTLSTNAPIGDGIVQTIERGIAINVVNA